LRALRLLIGEEYFLAFSFPVRFRTMPETKDYARWTESDKYVAHGLGVILDPDELEETECRAGT